MESRAYLIRSWAQRSKPGGDVTNLEDRLRFMHFPYEKGHFLVFVVDEPFSNHSTIFFPWFSHVFPMFPLSYTVSDTASSRSSGDKTELEGVPEWILKDAVELALQV
jgi:hypothetical protein